METERFEALIDAILAIIITIIVLEIPLASNGTWQALLDIKYDNGPDLVCVFTAAVSDNICR